MKKTMIVVNRNTGSERDNLSNYSINAVNNFFFTLLLQFNSVPSMWSLIEAEWSHVAEVCVSLLLHFVTLPCGSDIFWKLCENHFNHQDWKVRFQAG